MTTPGPWAAEQIIWGLLLAWLDDDDQAAAVLLDDLDADDLTAVLLDAVALFGQLWYATAPRRWWQRRRPDLAAVRAEAASSALAIAYRHDNPEN